jgi:hypothetical protein
MTFPSESARFYYTMRVVSGGIIGSGLIVFAIGALGIIRPVREGGGWVGGGGYGVSLEGVRGGGGGGRAGGTAGSGLAAFAIYGAPARQLRYQTTPRPLNRPACCRAAVEALEHTPAPQSASLLPRGASQSKLESNHAEGRQQAGGLGRLAEPRQQRRCRVSPCRPGQPAGPLPSARTSPAPLPGPLLCLPLRAGPPRPPGPESHLPDHGCGQHRRPGGPSRGLLHRAPWPAPLPRAAPGCRSARRAVPQPRRSKPQPARPGGRVAPAPRAGLTPRAPSRPRPRPAPLFPEPGAVFGGLPRRHGLPPPRTHHDRAHRPVLTIPQVRAAPPPPGKMRPWRRFSLPAAGPGRPCPRVAAVPNAAVQTRHCVWKGG